MGDLWGIILAAGKSLRMGKPKMLLPYRGKTIVETTINNILSSKVKGAIVVLGSGSDEILKVTGRLPVINCYNKDFEEGMLSSVQCGFRTLPVDFGAVIVLPGDQPEIGSDIINTLVDAYLNSDKELIVPVCNSKRGHPLLIGSRYRSSVENLDQEEGLRALLKKFPEDVLEVNTDSPEILKDIDTFEEYMNELKQIN